MAKVLLVEDDNNLREIYEARLQAEGYDIVTAHDGEEALVVAKNETPDLIISDVMMPKISGFEMLDILRNTDGLKDVKVIMLTALGQSDDQQRADRLGANRYLVKSQVTLEDIVKVAQDLLSDEAGAAPIPADALAPAAASASPVAVAPEPAVTPAPAPAAIVPEPPVVAAPPVAPPVDETPVTPAPAPSSTSLVAQSTTDEEANVEAQIEDFVTGATSDATPPSEESSEPAVTTPPVAPEATPAATEPAPAPAADQTPTVIAPAFTPPAPTAASVTDDKLITDALATFAENTNGAEAPAVAPSQLPAPAPAVASPAIIVSPGLPSLEAPPAPSVPIDGISSTAPTAGAPASDAAPTVAHKKVISPLDSPDKPDLNALLAREEANEAKPDTLIAPSPPVAGAPAPQPPAPTPPGTIDPNSIAL